MRVAVVSESFLPTLNGVTTSVCKVLDHLRAEGHEAIVISPAAGAPREYAGFRVHEVPAFAYRQFPVGLPSPQVHSLLAAFRPDVVHAASPFLLGAQAMAAAGRLGVPSVAIFQTDVAGYARRNHLRATTGLAWRLVRWVHDQADLTLAPSTASMRDLAAAGIERVERWGRGVDLESYHPRNRLSPAALALREQLGVGLDERETIVGYVGRLAPEKQLQRLSALRGLRRVRFAVVGDGPSRQQLERRLHGMPITWLGQRTGSELATAYAAFDVFLTPGTEETFGQTVQEAHAAGLPVVAPRVGGPIDLVDSGHDGFLYQPGDDRGLRNAVRRLTDDPALRLRMGEAGRRSVLDRSWASVCTELLQRYEQVISAGRPARKVSRSRAI